MPTHCSGPHQDLSLDQAAMFLSVRPPKGGQHPPAGERTDGNTATHGHKSRGPCGHSSEPASGRVLSTRCERVVPNAVLRAEWELDLLDLWASYSPATAIPTEPNPAQPNPEKQRQYRCPASRLCHGRKGLDHTPGR